MLKSNWLGKLTTHLRSLGNRGGGKSSRDFQPRRRIGNRISSAIPAMIEVLEPRRVLSSASACPNEYGGYHDSQLSGNVIQDFGGNSEQDSGFDDSPSNYGDTTLTAAVGDDPSNGTLQLNPDGSFVYTPDAGFAGVDSFTYTVS